MRPSEVNAKLSARKKIDKKYRDNNSKLLADKASYRRFMDRYGYIPAKHKARFGL